MPRAQCYYEILGVSETATTEEIKKAYKKLAVIWHPDKNQTNLEEAHAKFQTILKAYETLGDNKERDWYDRHKDQILSGGDKSDVADCLNLFQYFSSACYANFDDDEDGFYTVYREVFEKIAEEERESIKQAAKFAKSKNKSAQRDESNEFPTFGNSKSAYEDVVRPFYAFWSGFCTNLTFDHLDKYNTTEAENRRILRAMEKENKKVKDVARKERNTNVRNLVEFVKKRDRRLKAHKLLVEEQNELNRQKTAEKQRQQRERTKQGTNEYQPASSYLDLDDVEEQLRQLESEYQDLKKGKRARRRKQIDESEDEEEQSADEGSPVKEECDNVQASGDAGESRARPNEVGCDGGDDESGDDDEGDDEEEQGFYCPACNKDFRSVNAFENHEGSKKHKQNVQKLTKLLKAEEGKLNK